MISSALSARIQPISFSFTSFISRLSSIRLFNYLTVLILLFTSLSPLSVSAERVKTHANIYGHVLSEGEHLPYVNISVKGTTIGTLSDETGHFHLNDLPLGELVLVAQFVGYKPQEVRVTSEALITREVMFALEPDILGLEEVVVTGDRNARKRSESPVIVNSIQANAFNINQAASFGEALNYSPGLRLESNCQNCGFTQVRMNGMEGPYSQILINSRPIFSGLAGVYGLELIPSNMIDRIEVVRGAGSAIYGSNAIAGTINLILRDPYTNSYEVSLNSGVSGVGMAGSGAPAPDHNMKINVSLVSADFKTGIAMYGFRRGRSAFDANGDDFSELTNIDNTTLGARFYQRTGNRGKLAIDVFSINEDRRGGNRFDYPLHEADIAEAVSHKIKTGAAIYEHFTRDYDLFSLFISAQKVDRDSYYGANRSLSDYGRTDDMTYNAGAQYKALFGRSTLTSGLEYTHGQLIDKKLGYAGSENTIIANQEMATASLFAQHDIKWEHLLVSAGGRIDRFSVIDHDGHTETKQGLVISPRMNVLYDIRKNVQARLSYSKGFRAPQIFDEDLHIESSGSRKVIHENHPELKEETSHSLTASIEANASIKNSQLRFLLETFYTRLIDPFANEFGEHGEDGTVIYTRVNADGGALVKGINTELNYVQSHALNMTLGFTLQSNHYDEAQEFDETRFFRTPNHYGFLTTDIQIGKNWRINATSTYTGSMLVPYFGPAIAMPEEGMLRKSKQFFELGLGAQRNIILANAEVQLMAGVKNLLNAYQSDFDRGIDRDPGYMYGPTLPRTIYVGIKLSGKGK